MYVHLDQEKALGISYLWYLTLLLSVYLCLYLSSFLELYLCVFKWFPIVRLFIFNSAILLAFKSCSYGYLLTWYHCHVIIHVHWIRKIIPNTLIYVSSNFRNDILPTDLISRKRLCLTDNKIVDIVLLSIKLLSNPQYCINLEKL